MSERVDVDINELFRCSVRGLVAHPVIVLNGYYHADNDVSELPEGVLCCSMAEARERYPQLINKSEFGQLLSEKGEAVSPQSGADSSKISAASADDAPPQVGTGDSRKGGEEDGVFVYIPAGMEVERPIQIINLLYVASTLLESPSHIASPSTPTSQSLSNPSMQKTSSTASRSLRVAPMLTAEQRNCIVVGRGAKVSLLVCDHTITATPNEPADTPTAGTPATDIPATDIPATDTPTADTPATFEAPTARAVTTKEIPASASQAAHFLLNNMTEVVVEEGAKVDFIEIESQSGDTAYTNTINFTEERGASLTTMMLSLYGGEIRNNQRVLFAGEGANCNLYGCYIAGEEQKIDNFTYVDHAVPMCTSNELFKGAMDGTSSGNFMGCIRVRRDAQKTEAYQANNNLLLSDTARVNTKPQLIIDADDVKCSHGATIGRIDEEAMFYLRSRGIGEEEARMMMKSAFVYDIIRRIPLEPLRNKVASMVEKRLRGGRDFCENCKIACKK